MNFLFESKFVLARDIKFFRHFHFVTKYYYHSFNKYYLYN